MNLKKNIIVLFLLIFVIVSCKTIDRKIDNLSMEEEKNLSSLLGKQQIELINEFGKPNDVIHNDDGKILIFTTKKYNITCERKFTIDSKGVISGFNSRNCF
tara:strand:+ start:51 stop:353 length:303 start_codon:yes stop_codon:yes gene_type:complete